MQISSGQKVSLCVLVRLLVVFAVVLPVHPCMRSLHKVFTGTAQEEIGMEVLGRLLAGILVSGYNLLIAGDSKGRKRIHPLFAISSQYATPVPLYVSYCALSNGFSTRINTQNLKSRKAAMTIHGEIFDHRDFWDLLGNSEFCGIASSFFRKVLGIGSKNFSHEATRAARAIPISISGVLQFQLHLNRNPVGLEDS
ncbi:hypothetical protein [Streptomyces mangrovi]|uniref:hypothetical protein n=1 Tax=Streptomyces mangrovi TaxID=1206892 RepID=UPI00399C7E2E